MSAYWIDNLELIAPDQEAELVLRWEPIEGEEVIFSSHLQSGVPEKIQGKIGVIREVSKEGNMHGYFDCLTDRYARSSTRYLVEVYDPRFKGPNNTEGIITHPRGHSSA